MGKRYPASLVYSDQWPIILTTMRTTSDAKIAELIKKEGDAADLVEVIQQQEYQVVLLKEEQRILPIKEVNGEITLEEFYAENIRLRDEMAAITKDILRVNALLLLAKRGLAPASFARIAVEKELLEAELQTEIWKKWAERWT